MSRRADDDFVEVSIVQDLLSSRIGLLFRVCMVLSTGVGCSELPVSRYKLILAICPHYNKLMVISPSKAFFFV